MVTRASEKLGRGEGEYSLRTVVISPPRECWPATRVTETRSKRHRCAAVNLDASNTRGGEDIA